MDSTKQFFLTAQDSIEEFNQWVRWVQPKALVDHICFKCEDTEEFEQLRTMFEVESQYLYQSIISGRRILIVKFLEPLQTGLGDVWFLELSDQKLDGSQTSGFDHIEMYPMEETVESLVEELRAKGMHFTIVERPHHTTYDFELGSGFKVRLEPEALIEKIQREEM